MPIPYTILSNLLLFWSQGNLKCDIEVRIWALWRKSFGVKKLSLFQKLAYAYVFERTELVYQIASISDLLTFQWMLLCQKKNVPHSFSFLILLNFSSLSNNFFPQLAHTHNFKSYMIRILFVHAYKIFIRICLVDRKFREWEKTIDKK